jgi:hypothetical protein
MASCASSGLEGLHPTMRRDLNIGGAARRLGAPALVRSALQAGYLELQFGDLFPERVDGIRQSLSDRLRTRIADKEAQRRASPLTSSPTHP